MCPPRFWKLGNKLKFGRCSRVHQWTNASGSDIGRSPPSKNLVKNDSALELLAVLTTPESAEVDSTPPGTGGTQLPRPSRKDIGDGPAIPDSKR